MDEYALATKIAKQLVDQWENHDQFRPNTGVPENVTLAKEFLKLQDTAGILTEIIKSADKM